MGGFQSTTQGSGGAGAGWIQGLAEGGTSLGARPLLGEAQPSRGAEVTANLPQSQKVLLQEALSPSPAPLPPPTSAPQIQAAALVSIRSAFQTAFL